ncbi:MAG TPA: ribokinase [Nitrospinaceae bacterium]|jgi:ribokinase|nr:ribokinase [Nitrospinaceae bacterium]|tara:strand:- start:591 stop:1508 length:918 start_codon:yes stop_codon:yes gene_type:complete
MPKIVVVGSFVVGITFGVSRMPAVGETLIGDSFDLGPGGKGTNQAIGAARLDAQVNLLACVGDDIFADMALGIYKKEGLLLDHIHRMSNINTGVGVVTLMPDGKNWIIGDFGANFLMTPAHVDAAEALIAQSDIVMSQFEVPPETVVRAMELGRKHGAMTIWNPAPAKAVIPDLLANVDLLTPNETEVRILLGLAPDDPTPTLDLAQRLFALGVERIVVTKGKDGAQIVTSDGSEEIPAVEITPVDPTGAGDCFNAALAVALGQGKSLTEAVREGTYAGAYSATHLGVIDGLPTRRELDEFISKT